MEKHPLSTTNDLENILRDSDWHMSDGMLEKQYIFSDFVTVIEFVNVLWSFFEEAGRYPDFKVSNNVIYFSVRFSKRVKEEDLMIVSLIDNVYQFMSVK